MSSERPRWKEFDAVRSTLMNLALFQDTFVPPPPPSSPPTSGGPGKPDTKAIEREGPDVVVGKGLVSSLLALILSSSFTLTGSANCEELLPSQLLDRENSSKPTKIERRGGKTSSSGASFLHKVGLFGPDIDRDPIEPFTLYGDIAKKFFIENLDESGKIVSRRKGFTTTVCINAVEQSQDNPGVIGLPLSAKADRFGEPTCVEVFGQDFERTCDKACARGCEEQIRSYVNRLESNTGFKLEPGEPRRILVSCSKRCFRESQRPGANRPFSLTWLR